MDAKSATFVTDGRYAQAVGEAIPSDFSLKIQPIKDVPKFLREAFGAQGYDKVGIETTMSLDQLAAIRKWTRGSQLVQAGSVMTSLRRVKDTAEIASIRKAVKLADKTMAHVLENLLKVGNREVDIARNLRFAMEEMGADGPSFDPIIASGENGCRPHHQPGARKLRKGDAITVDIGCMAEGYCSDLTRNPVIGGPSKKFTEIHDVCLRANRACIAALKPGMTGVEADELSRAVVREAGFADFFQHGTGHGVGLEIHEAPRLSTMAPKDYKLEPGNIVTVEPGIYLPGDCGVRIEDYVLITETGCEVLSKAPRNLTILPA